VPLTVVRASAWRVTSYRGSLASGMHRSRIAKGAGECGTLEDTGTSRTGPYRVLKHRGKETLLMDWVLKVVNTGCIYKGNEIRGQPSEVTEPKEM